jgi:acyl-CoA synthetase (AMP-forming)/AMP-acid ligase II
MKATCSAAAWTRRISGGCSPSVAPGPRPAAPRGVTFVGELPKTATGKIQKYVLRKGAPNLTRQ